MNEVLYLKTTAKKSFYIKLKNIVSFYFKCEIARERQLTCEREISYFYFWTSCDLCPNHATIKTWKLMKNDLEKPGVVPFWESGDPELDSQGSYNLDLCLANFLSVVFSLFYFAIDWHERLFPEITF